MNRRQFLRNASVATATIATVPWGSARAAGPRRVSPNGKLNIGVVGVSGQGGANLDGVKGQNIVALCDVDRSKLAAAAARFPAAATFTDYRRMLDRNDLDAVVVSTPDHNHAIIAIAAMQSGRHVYCEKPLTHTLTELRRLTEVARKTGVVTQTGNQIHAGGNYRRVVELVRSGAIGTVAEVHHWAGSAWETRPLPKGEPVPSNLDYDQWIGPVAFRPYSAEWVPFNWRRWWHFGSGTLGDFVCHHTDLGMWALGLGTPGIIEAEGPAPDAECAPMWLQVRYQFSATKTTPATTMHWYSGDRRPRIPGLPDLSKWGGGTLFVGDKGMLLADYGRHVLLPEEKFKGFAPPAKTLADSVGHHEEWIRAIHGENMALPQFAKWGRTNSPFAYGALLTELGLLGNLAYRTGKRIEWDPSRLKAKGVPEADRFIHHEYRPGWKLG